jgi:hypothetical protein
MIITLYKNKSICSLFLQFEIIMKKNDVLQLALQFNFLIIKDTCNSLYLYATSVNKQVEWIVELQFIIYTMQLIAT